MPSSETTSVEDFYPRPPRGGRRAVHLYLKLFCIFLSTPSARRATYQPGERRNARGFLSTPSARRATFPAWHKTYSKSNFYPRPPRGGRRVKRQIRAIVRSHFYPRPPRGGRHPARHRPVAQQRFLSTPSARRATSISMSFAKAFLHFYPRPPRGGRPKTTQGRGHRHKFLSTPSASRATINGQLLLLDLVISIHALREEGDQVLPVYSSDRGYFYPRPPRGGRLEVQRLLANASVISIHALREEGDNAITAKETPQNNFYPRPPQGGRRISTIHRKEKFIFLSTPSARRATSFALKPTVFIRISIHALREEGDQRRSVHPKPIKISIHALREEGDPILKAAIPTLIDFYPRPPRGGRLYTIISSSKQLYFYPRPPRGGRQLRSATLSSLSLFLSTPSARRATPYNGHMFTKSFISIHALREEGDAVQKFPPILVEKISIHALREEGDCS